MKKKPTDTILLSGSYKYRFQYSETPKSDKNLDEFVKHLATSPYDEHNFPEFNPDWKTHVRVFVDLNNIGLCKKLLIS